MKRRNVVILMTDQQRFDTLGCTGNRVIRTPNLDRLAGLGVAFTHATTPQPVCGPARHSLHTGVATSVVGPQKFGKARWHPNGRFLAEVLAEAGYRTGGFGKMHFDPIRAHHGFQHFAVHEEFGTDGYREDDDYLMYLQANGLGQVRYGCGVKGLLYFQPQISCIPEEHHETAWTADRAIEFIETFRREPFFLFASWLQPHWPVHVPASFADLYSVDEIELPIYGENEALPCVSKMNQVASDMFDSGAPDSLARLKRSKALYYASISFIDKQVGRILDKLEVTGLLKDTLIVFTADHGEMLGDHLSFGKVSGYEPSIRVPLIAACPEMSGCGELTDNLATLYDVAPTVYDYTGVAPPPQNELVGASLLAEREAVRTRERVFFEIGDGTGAAGNLGVRTRDWKYVFYHAGGLEQLFDLRNDPHELDNLCLQPLTPEHCAVRDELHDALLAWNVEYGLPSRVEGGDFRAAPAVPIPPDRNAQYEEWVDLLPESEKAQLWSEARNVYEVLKHERHVDPADLDLEFWEARRGQGCIAELERLFGRQLRPLK